MYVCAYTYVIQEAYMFPEIRIVLERTRAFILVLVCASQKRWSTIISTDILASTTCVIVHYY